MQPGGLLNKIEGRMDAVKHREILEENLFQSARQLRLGQWFIFQQDNDLKHAAKSTLEWLQENTRLVGVAQPNITEHLNRNLKLAVHKHCISNLTAFH